MTRGPQCSSGAVSVPEVRISSVSVIVWSPLHWVGVVVPADDGPPRAVSQEPRRVARRKSRRRLVTTLLRGVPGAWPGCRRRWHQARRRWQRPLRLPRWLPPRQSGLPGRRRPAPIITSSSSVTFPEIATNGLTRQYRPIRASWPTVTFKFGMEHSATEVSRVMINPEATTTPAASSVRGPHVRPRVPSGPFVPIGPGGTT